MTGVTGCDGFPFNYPMRAHIRNSSTNPSYPSKLLKPMGKTRHHVPFKPFTRWKYSRTPRRSDLRAKFAAQRPAEAILVNHSERLVQ